MSNFVSPNKVTCFHCGKIGHTKQNCFQLKYE
ncbi:MAG: hypothetical protein GY928_39110 [Colwellia sp.]|nr:hypothetical protein [Colwellia sp.]